MKRSNALALLASTLPLGGGAAFAQTTKPLRVGAVLADTFALPYYAQEGGFFTGAGLTVEITNFANSNPMVAALAGEALDLALGDAISVANAVVRGVDFVYIGGAALYSADRATTGLCVRADSPIDGPRGFSGQTIGVTGTASPTEIGIREWLKRGGVDASTVKLYEMPIPDMLPAIVRGTVAGAYIPEPTLSPALATKNIREIAQPMDTIGKTFLLNGWLTTRAWISANPALTLKLKALFPKVAVWANTHQSDTAAILAKVAKIDPERLKSIHRATFTPTLDPKQLQPLLDLGASYKIIARHVSASELIY